MRRETTLSIWCTRLMEAGWLLAIALIPLYFNLFSARHFEPDKATSLRAIVLVLAALGLIRALERWNLGESRPLAEPTGNPLATWWRGLVQVPLTVAVLAYSAVFLLTTVTSVVPLTSFWGSYQRLQGTYTNLSYIGLFVIIVTTMRRREQFERLITVAISTCIAVACYGVLQHQGLDPLPWGGDVITRVASTMGNSIFVASYMLMIVPLALYRFFSNLHESRHAPRATIGRSDWLWALAHVLLLVSTLALLLSVFKFGAVVRTSDTRYWWAIPGAIGVAAALWALPTLIAQRGSGVSRQTIPLWPAALYAGYMLLLILVFAVSAASGAQQIDTRIANGQDWWIWLLVSLAALVGFYMLGLTLPPPLVASQLSARLRMAGYGLVTLLFLVAIFFTQSRGPWIGLGFGLFTFFVVLLWQMGRRARQQENQALAGRLRAALGAWVALTLAVGGFLIVFNLSDAPLFQQLRQVPYVGRMGRLLEVDEGTGLVRRLIWAGDQHAGGAVALITSDPLRAVIGWGPESMFVAFNRFYPPSLANVEARGASPDRSHQALLDELVTKGVLGLLSYFFLLFSAVTHCWRNMQRSDDIRWQFFFIAALSVLVGTFVDGLTGIPIVSTLMMFWTTLALVVVGGMLAGVYRFGTAPAAAPAVEVPNVAPRPVGQRNAGKRAAARGATATVSRGRSQINPGAMGMYVLLLVLALGGVWWFNLTPVYADMRFQEGQNASDGPAAGLNGLVVGMEDYLETIRSNPREDFYYLNLGRVLMSLGDELRTQGVPLGQADPRANVQALLELQDLEQVQGFVQRQTPLGMLSYAEAVLRQARDLNPLNKDHYANLGRLNNFWYGWTQDTGRLQQAEAWYAQVAAIAPRDVTLMNEHAGVLGQLGSASLREGDGDAAQRYFSQAQQLLDQSRTYDQRYADTDMRQADLFRLQGQLDEATERYIAVLRRNPRQLDSSIERIAAALAPEPDLIRRLRDTYNELAGNNGLSYAISGLLSVRVGDNEQAASAYERAVALQPTSPEFRRNYSLVLSSTMRYQEAAAQAREAVTLLQSQPGRQQEVQQLQALITELERKAGGR